MSEFSSPLAPGAAAPAETLTPFPAPAPAVSAPGLAVPVLGAMAAGHFLNDLIQAIVPAAYPMIQRDYGLNYAQIGALTMAYQFTASLLQPAVGFVTDRRPMDWALPASMLFSLAGVLTLAFVNSYEALFLAVTLVGIGSSIFHPEAARLTRMAAGKRLSYAQSVFQLGGYSGTAVGPLLVAALITPYGLSRSLWFAPLAVLGFLILIFGVLRGRERLRAHAAARKTLKAGHELSPARIWATIGLLAILVFASNAYSAVLSNFYTFFLIEKFEVSIGTSQFLLFLELAAVAAGVFFGGLVGDRIGRRRLAILSILGAAPLALLLPHVSLVWTVVLSMGVGALIASAFPSIVVMAQELLPRHVGLVTGGFFGFMFGVGGIAAAIFGGYADTHTMIETFKLAGLIPLLGVFGFLLPRIGESR